MYIYIIYISYIYYFIIYIYIYIYIQVNTYARGIYSNIVYTRRCGDFPNWFQKHTR